MAIALDRPAPQDAGAVEAGGILVTGDALRRVATILAAEPEGSSLRIGVTGGGCSGFQYTFDVANEQADDDLVFAGAGGRVRIDAMSAEYMQGCRIDFVDDLMGQTFKIDNPNATASCGCGVSFSL